MNGNKLNSSGNKIKVTYMDNLNNARLEAGSPICYKKMECLKYKINELATNSKNKSIRNPYRRINDFVGEYQTRSNLVKDRNGDLIADIHSILNR
jgi:hypothetical protein